MTPLDTALQWQQEGISTIPIRYRSKRPLFAWKKYQTQLPTETEIKEWFKSRFVNVAVITGFKGLSIIDFDNQAIWELWQSWINLKMPELLRKTYRVGTRRGQHVYLFLENPPDKTLSIKDDQNNTLIDIKAAGGYCLAPNSIHPSGHQYAGFNKPSGIMTVESLECVLPKSLLEKALKEVEIPCMVGGNNAKIDPWQITPDMQIENPIQWIKQNRSILEFFPNAQPSGANRWYTVLCPFHNDNQASGWLDVRRNRFGCQAGCVGSGIDLIDFYALLKNISRKESVRELAK